MGSSSDPFFVGFAISTYQCSGDDQDDPSKRSNWGHWNDAWKDIFGRTKIKGGRTCGVSNDFWDRFKEDIDRAKDIGSNAFRLSLEWSRLQVSPGCQLDEGAVARFHEILDYLRLNGMEPFLSMHHYVHPQWFEAMGGFQKLANVRYFVDYCKLAMAEFGTKVRFWCTFNEPGVASFAGFVHGSFPPGKMARIHGYGMHLRNMLIAHAEAYSAVKSINPSASVGIVHNWFTFAPAKSCYVPPYVTFVANLLNRMWGNDILIRFLKTGEFDYNPLWGWYGRVQYTHPTGAPGCDHFGLNYYSRGLMDWKLQAVANPCEVMTDMPYALWAEGLFDALDGIKELDVPIYITETGCADKGDDVRPIMIESYFSAIEEARRRKYDLRGVLYWSLVDNFEWAFGYTMKFGVFGFDEAQLERLEKAKSVGLLRHWFRRLSSDLPGF